MSVTRTLVPVEKLYTKAEAAEQLNVPLRFVERSSSSAESASSDSADTSASPRAPSPSF